MGQSPEEVRNSEKVLWEGSPELGLVLRNGLLITFLSPLILVLLSFIPLLGQVITVLSGLLLMVVLVIVAVVALYYYVESTDYILTETSVYVFSVLGDKQVATSTLESITVERNPGLMNIDRSNADLTLKGSEKVKFRNIRNPGMVADILRNDFGLE